MNARKQGIVWLAVTVMMGACGARSGLEAPGDGGPPDVQLDPSAFVGTFARTLSIHEVTDTGGMRLTDDQQPVVERITVTDGGLLAIEELAPTLPGPYVELVGDGGSGGQCTNSARVEGDHAVLIPGNVCFTAPLWAGTNTYLGGTLTIRGSVLECVADLREPYRTCASGPLFDSTTHEIFEGMR